MISWFSAAEGAACCKKGPLKLGAWMRCSSAPARRPMARIKIKEGNRLPAKWGNSRCTSSTPERSSLRSSRKMRAKSLLLQPRCLPGCLLPLQQGKKGLLHLLFFLLAGEKGRSKAALKGKAAHRQAGPLQYLAAPESKYLGAFPANGAAKA